MITGICIGVIATLLLEAVVIIAVLFAAGAFRANLPDREDE